MNTNLVCDINDGRLRLIAMNVSFRETSEEIVELALEAPIHEADDRLVSAII